MSRTIDDIMRIYSLRQNKAIDEQKKRKENLYERVPRLKEIEKELNMIGIEMAKNTLSGSVEAIENIKLKYDNLQIERKGILKNTGFPEDYLDIKYECSDCSDTGFLKDGSKCSCFKNMIIANKYSQSNLEDILERENFSKFDLNVFSDHEVEGEEHTTRENMAIHLSTAQSFCYNFKKNDLENLLLYGPTGNGKTFLINCIAKNILDKGYSVIYQTSFQLFDTIKKYRFSSAGSELDESDYKAIFEADLLIIDDLGTELVNSFTISELFNIINTRILNRKKTIISTNLSPIEINKTYTDRIFSRITKHYEKLRFYGKDLRWQV